MAYFEATKLKDSSGNLINPAEKQTLYTTEPDSNTAASVIRTLPGSVDDQIVLLRRIVKLMESQAAVDPQQRQRVTIDAFTAGVALPTVTAVTTVSTVTAVTTVSTVTSVTNIAGLFSWNQQILSDPARTSYNTGIRNQLTFS